MSKILKSDFEKLALKFNAIIASFAKDNSLTNKEIIILGEYIIEIIKKVTFLKEIEETKKEDSN